MMGVKNNKNSLFGGMGESCYLKALKYICLMELKKVVKNKLLLYGYRVSQGCPEKQNQ